MPRGRHSAPYNTWVQHERQKKYNRRQRTLTKYRRFQRHEERQESEDLQPKGAPKSAYERALELGPEAFEADFEQRLSISFGGVPGAAATEAAKSATEDDPTAAPVRGGDSTLVLTKRRKRLRQESAAIASAGGEGAGGEAVPAEKKPMRAKKAKKTKKAEDQEAAPDDEEPKPAKKGKDKKNAKLAATLQSAGRFSKDLKAYWRAEEEKEREWKRRQDEMLKRQQKLRENMKQRASKGAVLARRTVSGQPRMSDRLQALTAKLLQEGREAGGK